ncbi:MAG: protein kinase [Polyangiaceae bacterium]|nr:protein kinase [Polyangiaceae bacterium]
MAIEPAPEALPRPTDGNDEDDVEQARVRARVRQGLFGGRPEPVRLEQFELLGRLGEGAMGVVYEARDTELDRIVALKLLHPDLRARGERTELLLEEARAMARVRHPNVVTVHQVGTHAGQVYVAMERASGTLRRWLQRDRPTPARVLDVLLATGRGLAAVHRQGLVHRDFKMDNVLMDDDGQPRVSDFGLALATGSGSSTSPAPGGARPRGMLVGTPAYMAPEQLRGDRIDSRSDQWSFCVTAIEAFTGRRPFRGNSPDELLDARLARVTDADLEGVPPALAAVFRRGLDPEPGARFPSMDALLERLETARAAAPRGPSMTRRMGLAGVALLGAMAVVFWMRAPSAPRSSPAPKANSVAPPITDITRLCRTAVRTSSEKPAHPAEHAFDGVPVTAWTEASPGDGAGQWVEADLRPDTWVSEVEVGGGWSAKTASGIDLWHHNTTFRRMRVSWDGGEEVVTFNRDTDRGQRKRVAVNASTRHVRITALEVDRGRFLDLCLDEVVVFGRCRSKSP